MQSATLTLQSLYMLSPDLQEPMQQPYQCRHCGAWHLSSSHLRNAARNSKTLGA